MIYGYAIKKVNEYGLCEMKEITFSAPPATLREIALFLNKMASLMESGDFNEGSPEHIQDIISDWDQRFPDKDIIVIPPPSAPGARDLQRGPRSNN